MLELIMQEIASFLGGYFTEYVFRNKLGIFGFFLIIFIISILTCLLASFFTGTLTLKLFFYGLAISLVIATAVTLFVKFLYFLANRKK